MIKCPVSTSPFSESQPCCPYGWWMWPSGVVIGPCQTETVYVSLSFPGGRPLSHTSRVAWSVNPCFPSGNPEHFIEMESLDFGINTRVKRSKKLCRDSCKIIYISLLISLCRKMKSSIPWPVSVEATGCTDLVCPLHLPLVKCECPKHQPIRPVHPPSSYQ